MSDMNSGDGKQELQVPLKDSRKKRAEAGILAHFEAEEEILTARETIKTLRENLRHAELEVASLKDRIETLKDDSATGLNASESRLTSAMAERDSAVAESVALRTIVASMKKIWDMVPKGE